MGIVDWEARAAKFVKRVAQQLCDDPDAATSLLLPISRLEPLLRASVDSLPDNALRSALQKDFQRFVALLQHEITVARPDITPPPSNAPTANKTFEPESVVHPLSVARVSNFRVSFLADVEYGQAAEAAIVAGERVQLSSDEAQEWRRVSECLLKARVNPPLPLFWAYLTLARVSGSDSLVSGEDCSAISAIQSLWQSLKVVIGGLTDPSTAVAAIAPLVTLLLDALHAKIATDLKVSEEKASLRKGTRRFMKSLKRLVVELSSFVVVSRQKKHVFGEKLLMYHTSSKVKPGISEALERTTSLLRHTVGKESLKEIIKEDGVVESLPLISGNQRKRWRKRERVEFLADIVSEEIFLLQLVVLILEFRIGLKKKSKISTEELRKKLKLVAVHGVANNSLSSYEMLLDAILEPPSALHNILNAEEEILLKESLYEAVISIEPSDLKKVNNESSLESDGNRERASILFLKRLDVFRRALKFYRIHNLWARADTLLTTFAPPCAPFHLVNWFNSGKFPMLPDGLKDSRPITDWLLKAADEETFEELLHMHTTTSLQESKRLKVKKASYRDDEVQLSTQQSTPNLENSLFYVDTKGDEAIATQENEETELEAIDRALVTSAKRMWDSDNKNLKTKPQILFHRYHQSAGTKRQHREIIADASGEDESSDDMFKDETG